MPLGVVQAGAHAADCTTFQRVTHPSSKSSQHVWAPNIGGRIAGHSVAVVSAAIWQMSTRPCMLGHGMRQSHAGHLPSLNRVPGLHHQLCDLQIAALPCLPVDQLLLSLGSPSRPNISLHISLAMCLSCCSGRLRSDC